EPIFALEDYQKQRAMGFMTEYARTSGVSLYYSAHELEITSAYSDYMLLLFKDAGCLLGPTKEAGTDENLERAFGIPRSMMYQKERLHRQHLKEFQEHIAEDRAPFN
ncbi:MAG: ABC transporter ATP-binding protein, partial [Spirochaetales bacterium]|nr:ABC transporter ATP-binding protein [Spirochaetales bacterium]